MDLYPYMLFPKRKESPFLVSMPGPKSMSIKRREKERESERTFAARREQSLNGGRKGCCYRVAENRLNPHDKSLVNVGVLGCWKGIEQVVAIIKVGNPERERANKMARGRVAWPMVVVGVQ